jgi:hypothetical protein
MTAPIDMRFAVTPREYAITSGRPMAAMSALGDETGSTAHATDGQSMAIRTGVRIMDNSKGSQPDVKYRTFWSLSRLSVRKTVGRIFNPSVTD